MFILLVHQQCQNLDMKFFKKYKIKVFSYTHSLWEFPTPRTHSLTRGAGKGYKSARGKDNQAECVAEWSEDIR